jgi:site-specific recombinase XerD
MRQIDDFLKHLQTEGKSELTVQNYKSDISQLLTVMGENNGRDLSKEILKRYLLELRENFSPATVNRKLCAIKSYLAFSEVPNGWIKSLPIPERLPIFLGAEEMSKIRKAPKKLLDKVIINLLLDTGMRVRELHNLNREQFNNQPKIRIIGKRNREREVFLQSETLALIREYMAEKLIGPLLLNPSGNRLSIQSITKKVQHLAIQAGINKKVSPHILRHSFASQILAGGGSLYLIKKLLGHRSITSTLIYTHSNSEDDRREYQKAIGGKR